MDPKIYVNAKSPGSDEFLDQTKKEMLRKENFE